MTDDESEDDDLDDEDNSEVEAAEDRDDRTADYDADGNEIYRDEFGNGYTEDGDGTRHSVD